MWSKKQLFNLSATNYPDGHRAKEHICCVPHETKTWPQLGWQKMVWRRRSLTTIYVMESQHILFFNIQVSEIFHPQPAKSSSLYQRVRLGDQVRSIDFHLCELPPKVTEACHNIMPQCLTTVHSTRCFSACLRKTKKTTRTLKPDFPQKPTLHILPKPCSFCPWLDFFSPPKPGQHLPCQEESLRTPYPGQSASVDKTAIRKLRISLFWGGFMHPRWNIFGQQEGFSEIERRYPWRQQQPGKCFGTNEWELWVEGMHPANDTITAGWVTSHSSGVLMEKNIESEKKYLRTINGSKKSDSSAWHLFFY